VIFLSRLNDMSGIWSGLAVLSQFVLYTGVTFSAGLVLIRTVFSADVVPVVRRMGRQTAVFALAALGAAVSGFLLSGAQLTGDASGMTDPEILALLWQTPAGEALLLRLTGLTLILAGLFPGPLRHPLAVAGAGLALWSFTLVGHVSALESAALQLVLFLHLAGVAFWVGVLLPLCDLTRDAGTLNGAARLGHRFGQIATATVPLLLLAGLVMAWQLTGSIQALVLTGYGQILLAKAGFVTLVLALAALNKLRFVPALHRQDQAAAAGFLRSLKTETCVLLLVFATTALLTGTVALPE
jgi:putative copper resistance protein D